jgi:hypothetical protein
MLFLKTAPVGVDIPIQKLQLYLHEKLLAKWGLQNVDYEAYGRCYRNQKEDGYVAEVYVGGNEYKEVYLDDRISVLSFFGLSGDIEFEVTNTADVHLIFWVNIKRLYPAITHRADEEVRKDVQELVQKKMYGFTLTEVRLGIERVHQEYRGTIMAAQANLDTLKYRDMHPFHCFRFDLKLLYDIKHC